ncbi:hypothetical protein HDU98_006183 [Podochytrium sp. JEL0797]|nr:hypothetical protein HDU98_006183 [Podochytrium sp. JEL0797]
MSRVATILRKEKTHVAEELAHEHATLNFLSKIHPSLLDLKDPVSPTAPAKTPHLALTIDEALLDPDSLMYRQPYENASPIMSPNTQTSMLLSPGVGNKNKRKLSLESETGRYDPLFKRRNHTTTLPPTSSPNTTCMHMSPQTQPMSLPTSPSWRTPQPLGSANNPHPATPLLPGPVIKLSGHMGSPMMRRSTSASSTGSQMAGVVSGVSIFGTGGGPVAPLPPGSPRVGVVFGGGANVVVASPRGGGAGGASAGGNGNMMVVGTPTSVVANQFGQLLNMGGTQDYLSKMSLS